MSFFFAQNGGIFVFALWKLSAFTRRLFSKRSSNKRMCKNQRKCCSMPLVVWLLNRHRTRSQHESVNLNWRSVKKKTLNILQNKQVWTVPRVIMFQTIGLCDWMWQGSQSRSPLPESPASFADHTLTGVMQLSHLVKITSSPSRSFFSKGVIIIFAVCLFSHANNSATGATN